MANNKPEIRWGSYSVDPTPYIGMSVEEIRAHEDFCIDEFAPDAVSFIQVKGDVKLIPTIDDVLANGDSVFFFSPRPLKAKLLD